MDKTNPTKEDDQHEETQSALAMVLALLLFVLTAHADTLAMPDPFRLGFNLSLRTIVCFYKEEITVSSRFFVESSGQSAGLAALSQGFGTQIWRKRRRKCISGNLETHANLDNPYCYDRCYEVENISDTLDLVLAYLEELLQCEQLVYADCCTDPNGFILHSFQAANGYSYDTYHFNSGDFYTKPVCASVIYRPDNLNVYFAFSKDFTLWENCDDSKSQVPPNFYSQCHRSFLCRIRLPT